MLFSCGYSGPSYRSTCLSWLVGLVLAIVEWISFLLDNVFEICIFCPDVNSTSVRIVIVQIRVFIVSWSKPIKPPPPQDEEQTALLTSVDPDLTLPKNQAPAYPTSSTPKSKPPSQRHADIQVSMPIFFRTISSRHLNAF